MDPVMAIRTQATYLSVVLPSKSAGPFVTGECY